MNPRFEPLMTALSQQRLVNTIFYSLVLVVVLALSACGGGASTESNPVTNNNTNVGASSYNGPNAQTEDIRNFQINVWERLRASNRCGACHFEGGQSPQFVRSDDVNLAYAEATSLINLDVPANSRLVTKVGGGHNCWLTSNAACATAVTGYIEDWVAGTSGAGREIQLVAPADLRDPGATLHFPAAPPQEFVDEVWPLLTANCAGCHVDSSPTPQSPFFASSVVADAYEASKSKIDLANPAGSRFVIRLRNEFHNCWSNCGDDADELQAAIELLAGSPEVSSDPVTAPTVFSKALTLPEGIIASGGSRYEADVIALYEFKTGSGNVALDTSGVQPDLNLTLSGDVNWVGGWGIQIVNGKAQGSTTASKKLHDLIKATGEYSIEAWVAPANVVQEGPARIVSYSAGTDARNFTLGQTQYNYDFLQRSSTTDGNGEPALSTADADEDLQATLQHVVVTFDPLNGRRVYVNGVFTDDVDPVTAGNLNDWDDSFAFVLGNEVSGDRLWQGTLRMVAIHNRALTEEQIVQNFEVGVGEKFFLLFGIGDVVGVPDNSYIMFEVAQYDSYSYLFTTPTFINLDPNVTPGSIPLKRMSIGINGNEATVGQAYRNLDLTINDNDYDPETGQVLSSLGTIVALENGQDADEFFLTFEMLGGAENVFSETPITVPPDLPVPDAYSDIGVRTFDEINATMEAITTVDSKTVKDTYDVLRQQFPAVEEISGFVSAHQMAVAQLAIAYCDALVKDTALRTDYFKVDTATDPDFGFNQPVTDAYAGAAKSQIVGALYRHMVGLPGVGSLPNTGTDLSNMPTLGDVENELIGPAPNNLYDRLAGSCAGPADPACQSDRTRAIVKSMCAATLGSAAMLVQ